MTTPDTEKAIKAPKTKITVLLNAAIFNSFSDKIKDLGLRRDTYLNQVLPEEIKFMTNVSAGSKSGELVLRTLRSSQKDLVKVGITLDSAVAKKLTDACSEKHILRDQFLEACLAHLELVLFMAETIIINPGTHREGNTYENLAMSEEHVASLRSNLSEISKS